MGTHAPMLVVLAADAEPAGQRFCIDAAAAAVDENSTTQTCSVRYEREPYSTFCERDGWRAPDLALAFNSGLHSTALGSGPWTRTLPRLLQANVNCCTTAYNECEADWDERSLRSFHAASVLLPASLNPFRR